MVSPKEVYEEAKKKEDENLLFRNFLKANADERELDKQFRRLHNEIFSGYDCDKCRNCCKEYDIIIPEQDLERDAKKLGMKKSVFISLFLERDKDDGSYVVRKKPCIFLEPDGKCVLGNCRPKECKEYPYTNQPDRLHSLYNMLETIEVCPVAFEIYERLKEEYGFGGVGSLKSVGSKSIIKNTKDFLRHYKLIPTSAAGIEAVSFMMPEIEEMIIKKAEDIVKMTDEDLVCEKMISEANTKEDFFKLMRKPMTGMNRSKLRKRLLENEEMLMPLIKEKALKNGQDYFIENAFYFFAHAEEDCCNWIMSNFNDFRNEYMKSMLCLVLGIRGKEDVIPFLKSQVVRFIMDYPDERFEQGPLYGMDILIERLDG